jgi:hypothetical protein
MMEKIEILFHRYHETYESYESDRNMNQTPATATATRACSLCKQTGHDKRKCPSQAQAQAAQAATAPAAPTQKKQKKPTPETDVKSPLVFTPVTQEMQELIEQVCKMIASNSAAGIVLLRQKQVIQWLFGDLSFLPEIQKKNKTTDEKIYKVLEDKWGQDMLRIRRPDLKLDKQWTNKFGEHLCEEIFTLLGKQVSKPVNKQHYQPDAEVDDAILEAKAQTFFTSGTAGEKILGSPFKYAEVPQLYGKPLKILCMGGAEKVCRESYGNLPGEKTSAQKQKILECFREIGIEYIGATDVLKSLVSSS